ncbi:OsmC family protein [Lewinella cohaerens]|uniref:OsmC family protein n=1 Tax=Lewinella cohaerens TaxID=70995 RepID=UPI000381F9CC|nr:OsmC family protein [Lewinella cohaerens]
MKVTLERLDDAYHMQASNEDGLTVHTDGSPEIGGHNLAMRPMQMVLAALGSCSSIDIIYLLNKQRQPLRDIKIELNGERVDTTPKVFKAIHVHYKLFGDLDEKKAERACRLSMEKLCSVSMMLEKSVDITWSYEILA